MSGSQNDFYSSGNPRRAVSRLGNDWLNDWLNDYLRDDCAESRAAQQSIGYQRFKLCFKLLIVTLYAWGKICLCKISSRSVHDLQEAGRTLEIAGRSHRKG
ncbi:MAG: hypothetical protein MUF49_04555 [Oculatellaceae cyanobacterium Prado106]|jgi:hypothetical protein|nr:hypothetical protein [Oculatellaceae cyanobacterium Prado106]